MSGIQRYQPVLDYREGAEYPHATMEEDHDGIYVLAHEAEAEITRLRALVKETFIEGSEAGWEAHACDLMVTNTLWETSQARKAMGEE